MKDESREQQAVMVNSKSKTDDLVHEMLKIDQL